MDGDEINELFAPCADRFGFSIDAIAEDWANPVVTLNAVFADGRTLRLPAHVDNGGPVLGAGRPE